MLTRARNLAVGPPEPDADLLQQLVDQRKLQVHGAFTAAPGH
jgi:hypothetical protein